MCMKRVSFACYGGRGVVGVERGRLHFRAVLLFKHGMHDDSGQPESTLKEKSTFQTSSSEKNARGALGVGSNNCTQEALRCLRQAKLAQALAGLLAALVGAARCAGVGGSGSG